MGTYAYDSGNPCSDCRGIEYEVWGKSDGPSKHKWTSVIIAA